jgi:uncharacterized protein DUF1275
VSQSLRHRTSRAEKKCVSDGFRVAAADNEGWSIYGAQRSQPMATGGKWDAAKNREITPRLLPWVATGCRGRQMVRRGSTVRVRQRALQKACTAGLFLSDELAQAPACGGYGAVYGAFRSKTPLSPAARLGDNRLHQLRAATAVQVVLCAAAILVAAIVGDDLGSGSRYALIVLLALAMGVQNATARRLAVAELTTTVLTLTLTGIAADSRLGGGSGAKTVRRVLSVISMLLGAIVGALLLLQVAPVAPLVLAAAILVADAVIDDFGAQFVVPGFVAVNLA